ncbi:metal-sulfur cluster assembly factor [Ectobacillus ponti]|uniref:Metal-sulfur cluster assembly factor n=1 Tax=Ectobacillus ponti TaxID=2961894 RepID=A0AA42BN72_9BACI|nr:metal-sulfur cluster assembly factor [Ectobacillus ponti]MCP8967362.1 metal-sulfur cluster assembly factor [Ectobacillus ponti]
MEQEMRDRIYEALEEVVDPEIGIDIVNLGLVYEVSLEDGHTVHIRMTMTSIGCPLAGQIISDIQSTLREHIPDIQDVRVEVVWSPPWTKERMSRYAKIALGVHGA